MTTNKEFNRLSIASFDWDKAKAFATEAQQHTQNSIIFEALLFSAIICYYRPFSQNERSMNAKAQTQLKIEDFPSLLPDEQSIHDTCKHLRNKALAHSEFESNPTTLDPTTKIIASKPFSLIPAPFRIDLFVQLIGKQLIACHHKRANHIHGNPSHHREA